MEQVIWTCTIVLLMCLKALSFCLVIVASFLAAQRLLLSFNNLLWDFIIGNLFAVCTLKTAAHSNMQEEFFLLSIAFSNLLLIQSIPDSYHLLSIPAVLVINHVADEGQLHQVIDRGYNTAACNPKFIFIYSLFIIFELDNENDSLDINYWIDNHTKE